MVLQRKIFFTLPRGQGNLSREAIIQINLVLRMKKGENV